MDERRAIVLEPGSAAMLEHARAHLVGLHVRRSEELSRHEHAMRELGTEIERATRCYEELVALAVRVHVPQAQQAETFTYQPGQRQLVPVPSPVLASAASQGHGADEGEARGERPCP